MLKDLYTIKKEYEDYEIYIWNVNIASMVIFGRLAMKGVNVSGFLSDVPSFRGEYIMNRKIIGIDEIAGQGDVLAIVPDQYDIDGLQNRLENKGVIVLSYSDCLGIDEGIGNCNVLIYGTGGGSNQVEAALNKTNAYIEGYMLSDVHEKTHKGKKVYSLDEAADKKEHVVIVSTLDRTYTLEILENLRKRGFDNVYTYSELVNFWHMRASGTFTLVDYAYKQNKKILIYGSDEWSGRLMYEILCRYGICSATFVDEFELYDIAQDDASGCFIIIPDIDEFKADEKCNFLEKIGIPLSQYQYTGLALVERRIEKEKLIPDVLTGYAFENEFQGIDIIGDREAKFRIIVMGGSTSTVGYYRTRSWVEVLYEKLKNIMGDVAIFNMGFLANDVVIELLKLLRDGFCLKPDCVISLSGVNNTFAKKGSTNQFAVQENIDRLKALGGSMFYSGIESEEDLFEFWLRNQKIIKCVSEMLGAKYIGILQPMNIGKKNKSLFETMYFEDYMYEKCGQFYEKSGNEDFYMDMINEFIDKDGMYIDHCHYSEMGNAIIADKVFERILNDFDMTDM